HDLDGRYVTRQEHPTNALSGSLNERPPREPTVQRPHRDEKSFNARDSHPDVVQDESTFQSRLLLLPCPPCVTSDRLASAAIIPHSRPLYAPNELLYHRPPSQRG